MAVRKARRHIRRQCMAVYHEHLTTHDDVMGTADFRAVSELVPFLDEKEEEEARFRGLPLALASELCVWNGFCRGELGLLLTTVESERRRRIVLLLPLSTALSEDLRAATWR